MLLDKLRDKYPLKYPRYMSVPPEWHNLIEVLVGNIYSHLDRYDDVGRIKQRFVLRGENIPPWIDEYFATNPNNPKETFEIVQVKEKFDSLRFYVDGEDDFIRGLIAMACSMSRHIGDKQ